MIPALRDRQHSRIAINAVDQPMLARDAARPITRPVMLQRLGLAQPAEWTPLDVGDQVSDALCNLGIVGEPEVIVVGRLQSPDDPHQTSSRSTTRPAAMSAIASDRRRAFTGERSRCSVSMMDSYS